MDFLNQRIFPNDKDIKTSIYIDLVSFYLSKYNLYDDTIRIYLVLDGDYKLIVNGENYKLTEKSVYISVNNNFEMINTIEKNNLILILTIDREFIVERKINLKDSILYYTDENEEIINRIYGLLYAKSTGYLDDDVNFRSIVEEVSKILIKISKNNTGLLLENTFSSKIKPWTHEIIKRIAYDIITSPEIDYNLNDLSFKYGLSVSNLSKTFFEAIGVRYSVFLNMIRLSKSLEALLKTENNILTISLDVGFNNVKSYNQNFKKYIKSTPYSFKKKLLLKYNKNAGYNSLESVFTGKIEKELGKVSLLYFDNTVNKKITYDTNNMRQFILQKTEIFEKYILSVEEKDEFTSNYFEKIASFFNIKIIRVQIIFREDGKIYIFKDGEWEVISLKDVSYYIAALTKSGLKLILRFDIDTKIIIDDTKIINIMRKILSVLKELLGLVKLQEIVIELFICNDYSLDYEISNRMINHIDSIEKVLIGEFGIKNISLFLGELNNLHLESFKENILNRVLNDENIQYISFNITQNAAKKYIGNEAFDVNKLLTESYKLLEQKLYRFENKSVYICKLNLNLQYNDLPIEYYENYMLHNMITKFFWFINTKVSIARIKIPYDYFFISSNSYNKTLEKTEKREYIKAMIKNESKKNMNPYYSLHFYYTFIKEMYDEIVSFEDTILLSTNGRDYKCIFRLGFTDSISLLKDLENNIINKKEKNNFEISLPVQKGIYKLRTYSINSTNGNLINKMISMGNIEDFEIFEVDYLLSNTFPHLECESIKIEDQFNRLYSMEPFEVKYIELIKIK